MAEPVPAAAGNTAGDPTPTPPPTTTPAASDAPSADSSKGWLSSFLDPVEPARPAAFTLDPDKSAGTDDGTVDGDGKPLSSADYQHSNNGDAANTDDSKTNTTSKDEKNVIRAWLLAGAKRWEKGGGTANKRYEAKKAKHQANKTAEARTVTVNVKETRGPTTGRGSTGRTNGPAGGRSGGAGTDRKGIEKKSTADRAQHKNRNQTPAPAPAPKSPTPKPTPKPTPAPKPAPAPKPTPAAGNAAPGKQTPAPKTPKPRPESKQTPAKDPKPHTPAGQKSPPAPKPPKAEKTAAKDGSRTPANGDKPAIPGPRRSETDSKKGAGPGKPSTGSKDAGTSTDRKGASGKDAPKKTDGKPLEEKSAEKKPTPDDTKTPGKDEHKPKSTSDKAGPGTTNPKPDPTKPAWTARESREAGYRDGHRTGRATAHVRAWRDGFHDGHTDAGHLADADKARLDQARTNRTIAHPTSSPQGAVPPMPAHTPTNAEPTGPATATPVGVTHTDATHVHLGAGAARPSISRGEVRTLKSYERNLDGHTLTLTRAADEVRQLAAQAADDEKTTLQLLDHAQVAGLGDKVIGALTREAEAARADTLAAAELQARCARSIDAAKALQTNVDTRYSGIYKAIVDSPESTEPELAYFKG